MLKHLKFGEFVPLLDSIHDAALLKLSSLPEQILENLNKLHEGNLLITASSFTEQFEVGTDPGVRAMLSFNQLSIQTLTSMLTQIDEFFKQNFSS
jgi:hypothetical protein